MATTTDYGSVREVWFAKLADPSTKWSFLIRDDAYTKRGQQFGRTIRLGDPVTLGPNSSWTQLSWEGGSKQEQWKDKQMYQEGSADPQTKPGKLRMWSGWSRIIPETSGRLFDHYKFAKSGTDSTLAPLFVAEGLKWRKSTPKGGFRIGKWDVDKQTFVWLSGGPCNGTSAIRSMVTLQDATGTVPLTWLMVATVNEIWVYFENNNTWTKDTGFSTATWGHINQDSLINYNDGLYFCADNRVMRRKSGAFGVIGTYSQVRHIPQALWMSGIAVYNNRIYYGVHYPGARSSVEVTDGTSTQRVFDFPEPFWISGMVAHYGSLYIVGAKPSAAGPSAPGARATDIGQVWRYNGASLIKLWEEGDINDGKKHGIEAVATWNQNLVWTHNGYPKGGVPGTGQTAESGSNATYRPCLMFYDAEKDAIFEGPGIDVPPNCAEGVQVTNVFAWDNTLVACFNDMHDYGDATIKYPIMEAAYVRQADLVRNHFAIGSISLGALDSGTKSQFILSSRYFGEDDVALETKTWLSAKLLVRVPQNTQLRLALLLDEGTEVSVSTITYNGNAGWRTVTLPLNGGSGDYPQSATVQYKLYLENTDTAQNSTAIPEVDNAYISWRVAPALMRTWQVRAVAQDAQARLDGDANPLTTQTALEAKLQELYEEGKPVLFYEAEADGSVPGSSVEVNITDYLVQSYRVVSDDDEVVSEVTLTLVENAA